MRYTIVLIYIKYNTIAYILQYEIFKKRKKDKDFFIHVNYMFQLKLD